MTQHENAAFTREYMAMHRALEMLGFDVPKLIEFVDSEPSWAGAALSSLKISTDRNRLSDPSYTDAGMQQLDSVIQMLRPSVTPPRLPIDPQ